MSAKEGTLPASWKHPDELIKLQRLKQKKKQLAARIKNCNNNNGRLEKLEIDKTVLLEQKIAQKRKNPFAKSASEDAKRPKTITTLHAELEDSLLSFISTPPSKALPEIFLPETPTRPPAAKLVLQPFDAQAFAKLLQRADPNAANDDEADVLEQQQATKHLPMDWSIKTRMRFLCRTELPATNLKTSQMASGLTSFVRCIDTPLATSGIDISYATRFNQSTYYWQHPYLPWLTLFPRNSKDNIGITLAERERKVLADDWDHSFRGLFQLLRARQCPYFYLCANSFTVLFRAAGTAGRAEIHALITPTTRGLRNSLRQEGIEFTMPLKRDNNMNKSGEGSFTEESNTMAATSDNDTNKQPANDATDDDADDDDDDDEQGEEEWLKSLGMDKKEIQKIQTAHTRKQKEQEMTEDFSENSLLLIEGVECQGFFSFLLNAKSTIASVGRLAGVPPTLFSPVAFPKATVQQLSTRSSKVRMDAVDYHSIEVKGVILPTLLPFICQLLGEYKQNFSATMASSNNTLAFSKATKKLMEEPKPDNVETNAANDDGNVVFGQENLSDCGQLPAVIENLCRTCPNAISLLERIVFDKEHGYAWS